MLFLTNIFIVFLTTIIEWKHLLALGKITADRENNKQYRFSPPNYIGKQWKIVFVISQGKIVHIWVNNT